MRVSLFGSVDASAFATGWTREMIVSPLGGVKLDLSRSEPADAATLVVVSLVGSIDAVAPVGRRVTVAGSSVLGRRKTKIEQGDGPPLTLGLWSFAGSVKVRSAAA